MGGGMTIDVMKQALEALKLSAITVHTFAIQKKIQEATATLSTVIAEAEKQDQPHREGYWCANLACKKCYGADFRLKHQPTAQRQPLTEPVILALNRHEDGTSYTEGWNDALNILADRVNGIGGKA